MEEELDVSDKNVAENNYNMPVVLRRTKKKPKRRTVSKQFEVEVIKATIGVTKDDGID